MYSLALIDADSLVYKVGFSCNVETTFDQCRARLDYKIADMLLDLPIEGTNYNLYLTDSGNVAKEKIATFFPYKGNREKATKPPYYEEMRAHLMIKYGAKLCVGEEADDVIADLVSYARREGKVFNVIIAHIDKDLDQIPGIHYNFDDKEFYEVTFDEAKNFYWTQVLTGDPTDNIKGLPGIGPVKASQILATVPYDLETMTHLHYDTVAKAYYERKPFDFHGDKLQKYLHETMQLVKLGKFNLKELQNGGF